MPVTFRGRSNLSVIEYTAAFDSAARNKCDTLQSVSAVSCITCVPNFVTFFAYVKACECL